MLDRVHKISEIIASFAIVASLLFVGLQVSQNTDALKNNAVQTSAASWQEITLTLATDEDLMKAWIAQIPDPDFTVDEMRMFNLMAALLKAAELNYLMWLDGNLSDDMWSSIRENLVGQVTQQPFYREFWTISQGVGYTSPFRELMAEVVAEVESAEATLS
jgi:hypothetical protein